MCVGPSSFLSCLLRCFQDAIIIFAETTEKRVRTAADEVSLLYLLLYVIRICQTRTTGDLDAHSDAASLFMLKNDTFPPTYVDLLV